MGTPGERMRSTSNLSPGRAELKGTAARVFLDPRVDRTANPSRILNVNREYRSHQPHDYSRHSHRLADAQSDAGWAKPETVWLFCWGDSFGEPTIAIASL